jgi:hypothetical protein
VVVFVATVVGVVVVVVVVCVGVVAIDAVAAVGTRGDVAGPGVALGEDMMMILLVKIRIREATP